MTSVRGFVYASVTSCCGCVYEKDDIVVYAVFRFRFLEMRTILHRGNQCYFVSSSLRHIDGCMKLVILLYMIIKIRIEIWNLEHRFIVPTLTLFLGIAVDT